MKTKSFFAGIIAAAALVLGFASSASACDVGNACGESVPLSWQPASGLQIGGDIAGWGKALAGSNGVGDTNKSAAYTLTEGTTKMVTDSTLTVDALGKKCTTCGDNQINFVLSGTQMSAAGAQNMAETAKGPASSMSQSLTGAGLYGTAWGRSTVPAAQ